MGSNLKKGIIIIFISNLINMGFKVFINFVQPAYLSVDTYAMIQTFYLYVSYVGLLHLGYVDGMYLKYGGKDLDICDRNELSRNVSTLRTLQLILTVVAIVIGFCIKDIAFIAVGFTVLPANIASYFRMLFQATGKFNMYGRIMNLNTILLFLYNFILIFILHIQDNYLLFLVCEVVIYFIMFLILEIIYYKKFKADRFTLFAFDKNELKTNISEGLPLTLGNLSSVLFTSLDRWFVKFLLTEAEFAYYAFAVSIETFMNVAVSPVTITMYNYFCNHKKEEDINRVKRIIVIFAVFLVSSAFPAKFIVENFITKYNQSTEVLFVLFSAKILSIVIQGVYVNLYKSHKRQKEYLVKLIICIVLGAIFNTIAYFIYKANISFAIATLGTVIVWFIISALDFKFVKYSIKDLIYIILSIIMINTCGLMLNSIVGFVVYIVFELILSLVLQNDVFIYSIKNILFPTISGFIGKRRKS